MLIFIEKNMIAPIIFGRSGKLLLLTTADLGRRTFENAIIHNYTQYDSCVIQLWGSRFA